MTTSRGTSPLSAAINDGSDAGVCSSSSNSADHYNHNACLHDSTSSQNNTARADNGCELGMPSAVGSTDPLAGLPWSTTSSAPPRQQAKASEQYEGDVAPTNAVPAPPPQSEGPAKRKRGRPRKHRIPNPDKPRSKRGRSRSNSQTSDASSFAIQEAPHTGECLDAVPLKGGSAHQSPGSLSQQQQQPRSLGSPPSYSPPRDRISCGSCGKLEIRRYLRRIYDGFRVCGNCAPLFASRSVEPRRHSKNKKQQLYLLHNVATSTTTPGPAMTERPLLFPSPSPSSGPATPTYGKDATTIIPKPQQIQPLITPTSTTPVSRARPPSSATSYDINECDYIDVDNISDDDECIIDICDISSPLLSPPSSSLPVQPRQIEEPSASCNGHTAICIDTDDEDVPLIELIGAECDKSTADPSASKPHGGVPKLSKTAVKWTSQYQLGQHVQVLTTNRGWHLARIVLLDQCRQKMLVHYPGLPLDFDEWVCLKSGRLRPPFPASGAAPQASAGPQPSDAEEKEVQRLIKFYQGYYKLKLQLGIELSDKPTEKTTSSPTAPSDPHHKSSAGPIAATGRGAAPPSNSGSLDEQGPKRPRKHTQDSSLTLTPGGVLPPVAPDSRPVGRHRKYPPLSIVNTTYPNLNAREGSLRQQLRRRHASDSAGPPSNNSSDDERNIGRDSIAEQRYVTTGAFLTRRAQRFLAAHSDPHAQGDNSDFVVSSYLGWSAGQDVEVLNIDKRWYHGCIITFERGKALVHFPGWGHACNEWVDTDSPRLRACLATATPAASDQLCDAEAEQNHACPTADPLETALRLWREHKQHLRSGDKGGSMSILSSSRSKANNISGLDTMDPLATTSNIGKPDEPPLGLTADMDVMIRGIAQVTSSHSNPVAHSGTPSSVGRLTIIAGTQSVSPLDITDGRYRPLPQLLSIDDYKRFYQLVTRVAVRDRNRVWWEGEVKEVESFRARVSYAHESEVWDEWVEMNTQRVMVPKETLDAWNGLAVTAGSAEIAKGSAGTATDDDGGGTGEPQSQRADRKHNKLPRANPLSMRLAYKTVMEDEDAQLEAHPEDRGAVRLNHEQMTTRDYHVFYRVGDRIRAFGKDKVWYEAFILAVKHGRIKIRFEGWPPKFDEWIEFNSPRIRVLRATVGGDNRLEQQWIEEQRKTRRVKEQKRAERRKVKAEKIEKAIELLASNLQFIVPATNESTPAADSMPQPALPVESAGDHQIGGDDQVQVLGNSPEWSVYCNQCKVVIKHFRYFCTYCEKPSDGYDYTSFELCLWCFSYNFPREHQHPRSVFARTPIADLETLVKFTPETKEQMLRQFDEDSKDLAASIISAHIYTYEQDVFDPLWDPSLNVANPLQQFAQDLAAASVPTANDMETASDRGDATDDGKVAAVVDTSHSHNILRQYRLRRRCAFCGEDELVSEEKGLEFISNIPFLSIRTFSNGKSKYQRFWAHIACAKHSPEVVVIRDPENGEEVWYNVAAAMRRGRSLRCTCCRQRGATIGCFETRCMRNYHLACTGKSISHFKKGIVFWCPQHEAEMETAEPYVETYQCDNCERVFKGPATGAVGGDEEEGGEEEETWKTCTRCEGDYFSAFDVCNGCFESGTYEHQHPKSDFRVCSVKIATEMRRMSLEMASRKSGMQSRPMMPGRKRQCGESGRARIGGLLAPHCQFCWTTKPKSWRKGYGGMLMCQSCFAAATSFKAPRDAPEVGGVMGVEALNPFGTNMKDLALSVAAVTSTNGNNQDGGRSPGDYGEDEEKPLIKLISAGKHQLTVTKPLAALAPSELGAYLGPVEDYVHNPYFTREACAPAMIPFPDDNLNPHPTVDGDIRQDSADLVYLNDIAYAKNLPRLGALDSYAPTENILFTLPHRTTYYDIPGRAPRWASHSGTDYHGTWLPQTVRRAILRYTRPGERILSTFIGRGTDAIESFLLKRKCVGVDINPAAVALAQRNCSFTVPPSFGPSADYRPIIVQGDSRRLGQIALSRRDGENGGCFKADESFDFVLSHPPYKDCVAYSTHIEGDLSRFPGPDEYHREMRHVVNETWRLLKTGRYCVVGIGDNRAECFYIPLGFQLIRNYVDQGFELDEIIIKRQRYCQMFGLGTYLCVQFDFLMFTHEFILTLRKVPRDKSNRMILDDADYCSGGGPKRDTGQREGGECNSCHMMVRVKSRAVRPIPHCPIDRRSVVMGSVWTFNVHRKYPFPMLCMSRMVERFGRDDTDWEQVELEVVDPNDGEPPRNSCHFDNPELQYEGTEDPSDGSGQISAYERERLTKIRDNKSRLLALGLVSELGEESEDVGHYRNLMAQPLRSSLPDAGQHQLSLIVIPHVPQYMLGLRHVADYRRTLIQCIHDASRRLALAGLLIIGVQDIRDENGKLWPMGMLIDEDVHRAVGSIRLRLKELIVCVERGWECKKDECITIENFKDEECIVNKESAVPHIPIVHVYYMVFMRLE